MQKNKSISIFKITLMAIIAFSIVYFLIKNSHVQKIIKEEKTLAIKKDDFKKIKMTQNSNYIKTIHANNSGKQTTKIKIKEENIKDKLLYNFKDDITFGNPNAPVTIIEYSSFTCYHCIKMHNNVMEKLQKEYIDTNKVKFVHRAMVNSRTIFAKMLQHCTNEQNTKKITTDLFNTSKEWAYSENILDQLKIIGSKYGIDNEDFDTCIKNKKLGQSIINKQIASSKILGVNSTPTLFINKEMVSGARSYKELKKIIDRKLLEINTPRTEVRGIGSPL